MGGDDLAPVGSFPRRRSWRAVRCAVLSRALRELGWLGRIKVARSFSNRLVGLAGRSPARARDSVDILVFPRCRSVHTCFMRFPIDIAFIDVGGDVLECHESVDPWRFLSCPGASFVLERPSSPRTSLARLRPKPCWAHGGRRGSGEEDGNNSPQMQKIS